MLADPFARYAELRRTAPVSRVTSRQMVGNGGYMLTRYEDVMRLHTDKAFSSDMMRHTPSALTRVMPRVYRLLMDSMVFKDDPEHKRLRGLVAMAFTPKMVQRLAESFDKIVGELLDTCDGDGPVDLVARLAVPLPLRVIADMLGVAAEDRDEFHRRISRMTESAGGGPLQMVRGLPNGRGLIRLLEKLADLARAHPDDQLISALVRATDDGDRLGDQEIIAMIFLLLLAGHDTTANLIGNATLELVEHPEQLARLREDPSLIDSAVEELLRYTSPVPSGAARITLEDTEVADVVIPRGSRVVGMIISANRDEEVFDAPDELDLGRDPNRHIAFAFGSHFCLGSQLARLEGRAAIGGLVQRFARIELAVPRPELKYKPTQSLRGLRHLPLRLR